MIFDPKTSIATADDTIIHICSIYTIINHIELDGLTNYLRMIS